MDKISFYRTENIMSNLTDTNWLMLPIKLICCKFWEWREAACTLCKRNAELSNAKHEEELINTDLEG
jgi:hypothetical protein